MDQGSLRGYQWEGSTVAMTKKKFEY
jgi:hypothetical protein